MFAELLLLGLPALIVAAVFGRSVWRAESGPTRRLGLAAAGLLLAATLVAGARYADREVTEEADVGDRPIQVPTDGYVSSDHCRSCHPREYETWHQSYHRTMTQVASPDAVIPEFDGVELEGQEGKLYRLEQRGDDFFVTLGEKSLRVAMTTGSHHFQAFWFEASDSRKNPLFSFCYRCDEERWIPIHYAFILPPGQGQGVQPGRWNESCIRCHATHGRPGIEGLRADTRVSELGIACESCHGPAEEHVAYWRNPWTRLTARPGEEGDSTIVNPARLDAVRSSSVCGQCHGMVDDKGADAYAQWKQDGSPFRPGDEFSDKLGLIEHGGDEFWSDGMVRVSGREYNGLLGTPCYQHGDPHRGVMSCVDCHTMHRADDDPRVLEDWRDDQLTVGMESDGACLQCHQEYEDPSTVAAHTHHPVGSAGSQCMNCHMPNTNYGLLKATRSHQLSSPDIAVDLEVGRPNACNLCHLDRTLEWTGEHLAGWYGRPAPDAQRQGSGLTAEEREVPASVLHLLSGDAGQRALVAWHLGWAPAREVSGTEWMPPLLAPLLSDPYHPVRFIAVRSLRKDPEYAEFEYDSANEREALRKSFRGVWKEWFPRNQGAVQIQDHSRLSRTQIEELWARRNDRPMSISE